MGDERVALNASCDYRHPAMFACAPVSLNLQFTTIEKENHREEGLPGAYVFFESSFARIRNSTSPACPAIVAPAQAPFSHGAVRTAAVFLEVVKVECGRDIGTAVQCRAFNGAGAICVERVPSRQTCTLYALRVGWSGRNAAKAVKFPMSTEPRLRTVLQLLVFDYPLYRGVARRLTGQPWHSEMLSDGW